MYPLKVTFINQYIHRIKIENLYNFAKRSCFNESDAFIHKAVFFS